MLHCSFQELNEFGGKDILLAAYFHASFENIHPFADGNGQVGRTLLNYYLMIHNEPPVIKNFCKWKQYEPRIKH